MAKVDWDKIREEFETTPATLQQLAEKYNISPGTVRSRKSREGWEKREPENPGKKAVGLKKKPATQRKQRNIVKRKPAIKNRKEHKKPVIKIEDVSEGLTEKERLFCWRYIHNFNATQAYLWAFKCGYGTAGVEGHKLLKKPKIKAEIERLKKLKFEALQITPDDIVERYMRIAFADMTDFITFGQKEVPIITEEGIAKDAEGNILTETVNYIDFNDYTQVDGGLICEIKKGRQGMSIKLEDRQKALDWLASYFEMNPMDRHKVAFDKAKLKLEEQRIKQLGNEEGKETITEHSRRVQEAWKDRLQSSQGGGDK